MRRKNILIVLFLVSSFLSKAQVKTNLNAIVPKSPEATAMEKVNSVDVSSYTGAASLSIPLLTLEDKNMKLPVQLAYSASGLRLDQLGSSVGMGWTQTGGGVVSRQVRGLPDAPGVNRSYPPNDCSDLNQALKTYLDALTLPVFDKDAQPDLFTYQFAGYSGSFYLDDAGNAVELKKTTLKIQVTLSGSVTDSRYNCVIITPDGITYTFDAVEKTYSETIGTDYTGTLPTMNYVQTASFLTTIQHPVYGLILFQYISADAQGYTGVAQTYEASDPNNVINNGNSDACTAFNVLSTTKSKTYYQGMKLLASISNSVIGGGRLVFDYEDRKDLVGGKLLKAISLYSGNLKLKSVQLLYQQVRSAIPNNFSSFLAGDSALLYRYFLSQVRFLDAAAKEINRYSFAYYPPEDLPHRLNFSQDHAGYYNAKPNANSFLPPVTDATVPANLFPLATADREPDALAAQKGSISSITYPTGGKDSLEYELHRSTVTTESILNGSLNLLVRTASDETNKSATSAAVTITNVKDQPLTLTVKSLVAIGSTDPPPDPDVNYLHYVFTDVTSNTVMLQGDLNFYQQVNTKIYNFSPGHSFQLSLTVLVSNCRGSMSLVYATGTQQVSVVKLLPGLRIKRILTSDGSGNLSPRKYYYSYLNDWQNSSGTGYLPPQYLTSYIKRQWSQANHGIADCRTFHLTSNSASNLYLTQAGAVVYKSIIEGHGENFENGAIERLYNTDKDQSSRKLLGINNQMLYTGNATNTGSLGGVAVYTASHQMVSGVLQKIKDVTNYYSLDSRVNQVGYGYEMAKYFEDPSGNLNFDGYDVRRYQMLTRWAHLDSVVEKMYAGTILTTKVSYEYDNPNHQLPSRSITATSDGKVITQQVKYPFDYTGLTASDAYSAGVRHLRQSNIQSEAVESVTTVQQGSQVGKVKAAVLNVFSASSAVKTEVQAIEASALLSNFSISSVSGGAFQKDGQYKSQLKIPTFDVHNNPLVQQKQNDVPNSYIWDYQLTYPVAEVINADPVDIAYTSFEADGKGNWSFTGTPVKDAGARTGGKVYILTTGSIIKSSLNSAKSYVVSYWSKDGSATVNGTTAGMLFAQSGWFYYEHKLQAGATTVTISGAVTIDELRLHPAAAHMVTYTYQPLVGMTSQTDANGRTGYYEYDGFGRLSLVRDYNNNILKKYCYNYAGQPENCSTTNTAPMWQPTGNYRCMGDSNGYVTGYQLIEQSDTNSLSQSHGFTRWVQGGYNPSACLTCNPAYCNDGSNFHKCINSTCELGALGIIGQYNDGLNTCSTDWGYTFSDKSIKYQETVSGTCNLVPCDFVCQGNDKKCMDDGRVCEQGQPVVMSTYFDGTSCYRVWGYKFSDGTQRYDHTEQYTCQ